ncbi:MULTISPECIES: AAA family ATPase [Bradyrhizobium]|uniref:AAA family ATPase n=1 Tax=Bradyrhizobium TaxID=374 RepID=UPI0020A10F5D|nr:AAA family ATPase [Bradyrhizobium elkanii]MCP1969914.1 hypothetical protein [Bradyrhizobium elkanii]MCS4108578.1 hypothetical protein [Bradyrhizobium elkanii]
MTVPEHVIERAWQVAQPILNSGRNQRRAKAKGFAFKLFREFDHPAQEGSKAHIIKKIFAWGETSAWIGPPGSLKSSLLADAAVAIASGSDWFGYKSKGPVSVVYFALERADLVERRIWATAARRGITGSLPIAIVPGIVDLAKPGSVEKIVNTIREVEGEFLEDEDHQGDYVGLAIFDTFAKLVAAGGGDEDKASHQGAVFTGIQRVKDLLGGGGPHIALIGHTGKDESRGARGSNAFLGDADLMVTLSGEGIKTATVTKANDAPEGPLFSFIGEVCELGADEDGDPITVNIVSREEVTATSSGGSTEPKLSTNQRVMYRLLSDAGPAGLTTEAWSELAKAEGITVKQRHYETRMALKDKGLVREYAGIWRVNA